MFKIIMFSINSQHFRFNTIILMWYLHMWSDLIVWFSELCTIYYCWRFFASINIFSVFLKTWADNRIPPVSWVGSQTLNPKPGIIIAIWKIVLTDNRKQASQSGRILLLYACISHISFYYCQIFLLSYFCRPIMLDPN